MKIPNLLKPNKNGNRSSGIGVAGRTVIHRVARDPYVDWAIISVVSFLMGVALIILSLYTYLSMDSQSSPVAVASSQSSAIDTESLMTVLGKFSDRAAERSALLRGYNGPGDPSM